MWHSVSLIKDTWIYLIQQLNVLGKKLFASTSVLQAIFHYDSKKKGVLRE